MKLLQLDADRPSFRTLQFRERGVSLIVGEGRYEKKEEGSANGVGKTLALRLVHLCLGGNPSPVLRHHLADWRFGLEIDIAGTQHRIERHGDGSGSTVNGQPVNQTSLRDWLNRCGAFVPEEAESAPTFRQLYKRFARAESDDCRDPLRVAKEQPDQSLWASLFLLGLDTALARRKVVLRQELQRIRDLENTLRQDDPTLARFLRTRRDVQARLRSLEADVIEAERRLAEMQIAKDYQEIRGRADVLTAELRELEQRQAILAFQIRGIEKSLEERPDLDRTALLGFYDGLQEVFRPEALKTFADVESFHTRLARSRRDRLESDRRRLEAQQAELNARIQDLGRERDDALRYLAGRHALDEYLAVARNVAAMREERETLRRYVMLQRELEQRRIAVRRELAEDDERARAYCAAQPLATLDERFRTLARLLYPGHDAGLTLENNTGDNRLRYDLWVTLTGQDSDGINAARVLIFDWIVYRFGARHTMRHLWHDNRLFADLDPAVRARWFAHVSNDLVSTDAQYIASINAENFAAMQDHLSAEVWRQLETTVIVRLSGERSESKLLGVQLDA